MFIKIGFKLANIKTKFKLTEKDKQRAQINNQMNKSLISTIHVVEGSLSRKFSRHMLQASSQASGLPLPRKQQQMSNVSQPSWSLPFPGNINNYSKCKNKKITTS
jgi:hypothetical protein